MSICPFCDPIIDSSDLKICDYCSQRLSLIDFIIKQWNDSSRKKVSVEVKINES